MSISCGGGGPGTTTHGDSLGTLSGEFFRPLRRLDDGCSSSYDDDGNSGPPYYPLSAMTIAAAPPPPPALAVGLLALLWIWILDEAFFRERGRAGVARNGGASCRCRVCTLRMQARGRPRSSASLYKSVLDMVFFSIDGRFAFLSLSLYPGFRNWILWGAICQKLCRT